MASSGAKTADKHGFVLVVPRFGAETQLALQMKDGRYALLCFAALQNRAEIKTAVQRCWLHSGTELVEALNRALGDDDPFVKLVDDGKPVDVLHRFAAVDHTFVLAKCALVLHGWIAKAPDEIERIELGHY